MGYRMYDGGYHTRTGLRSGGLVSKLDVQWKMHSDKCGTGVMQNSNKATLISNDGTLYATLISPSVVSRADTRGSLHRSSYRSCRDAKLCTIV